MKINKISSQNFGQIYFDSKDLEQKIRLKMADLPNRDKNKLNELIFRNMHSDKYDIHVKENGNVYIRNNQNGDKTEVLGMVSILDKFQAALGYARINEIRDEYNKNA